MSGDLGRFTVIVSILLCFILGAFVSGIIVGDNKLRLSNLYTVCLLVQSIAIFLAYGFLQEETYNGEICLAFACGMQNALCSAYTGPVLRTTHITGNVTEIGVILGYYIHHMFDREREGRDVETPSTLACYDRIHSRRFRRCYSLQSNSREGIVGVGR